MTILPSMPCASSARGAGWAKPGSVSALSSPESTKQPAAQRSPSTRAAASSSTGTTSEAPLASAATMVVVANRMSSTTTTLPCTRTLSSSSLRVSTCTLWLSSSCAATSAPRSAAEHAPAFHRHHQLAILVYRFPAGLHKAYIRAACRGARLQHHAAVPDGVAGAHRLQPADVFQAGRAQALRAVDVALHGEPHADRAGMPAARD